MKHGLKNLGESGVIALIERAFGSGPLGGDVGVGDDCAVIHVSRERSWLVTTDLLVEGVHFLRDRMTPRELGHKALAVNLSDIAAMGGSPRSAFLSWALPRDVSPDWVKGFLSGVRALATETGVQIMGGDTTASLRDLFINLTVIGEADPRRIKYRSTARAGDYICVTGTLGDSRAGLKLLLEKARHAGADERWLVREHVQPTARLREGAHLAAQSGVTAMMDLSDGLAQDVTKLATQSGVGADLQLEGMPVSAALRRLSRERGWDARQMAASGGEDYELLVCVDPRKYESINRLFRRKFRRPLVRVGEITPTRDRIRYFLGDNETSLSEKLFQHF